MSSSTDRSSGDYPTRYFIRILQQRLYLSGSTIRHFFGLSDKEFDKILTKNNIEFRKSFIIDDYYLFTDPSKELQSLIYSFIENSENALSNDIFYSALRSGKDMSGRNYWN